MSLPKPRLSLPLFLLLSLLGARAVPAQEAGGADDVPSWEELAERPFPAWFRDAKLGIFIHWGIYSVPSWSGPEQYAEWFLRGLQVGDEPRQEFLHRVYGEDFRYRDFAPHFKAELFDPAEWAALFRDAGARYVVLTSKHHDGFALWPSEHASGARGFPWNAVEVGPRRDLVGDLAAAIRDTGLRMGLYYSLPEWNHPLYRWGNDDPQNDVHRYVREHMIPQFRDVMSRYRPAVIFSDGEWDHPASTWHSAELIHWLYTASGCPPDLAINDRWGGGSKVGFRTPEYSAGAPPGDRPWVECRGLGRSFGLNRNEKLDAYLSPRDLVHFFARAVSHGGGMLLNVGPGSDGRIPLLQQERLRQLGAWLAVNGEAIYGAKTWERLGEWRPATVERIDASIDFDWVRNTPADGIEPDQFTASWRSFLRAPESGVYRFRLEADDDATLWIGGEPVATKDDPGSIELTTDIRARLRVDFTEKTHQALARLYWQPPHAPEAVVPADAFWLAPRGGKQGLQASYESRRQTVAYTHQPGALYATVFEWPGDELAIEMSEPDRHQPEVRLLGLDRALPSTWSDGILHIDTSGIGIADLPCRWAWTFRVPLAGD